jgi:hypothetical protein
VREGTKTTVGCRKCALKPGKKVQIARRGHQLGN